MVEELARLLEMTDMAITADRCVVGRHTMINVATVSARSEM